MDFAVKWNFSRRGLFFLLLAAFSCGMMQAAAHTDFSGTWKLDAAKSNLGPFPGPRSLTDKITQTAGEITVNRDRAGEAVVIHLPLDGTERPNTIRGNVVKTTVHWQGTTLVIDYIGLQRGKSAKSEEQWSINPDGKTMKVTRDLSGAMGKTRQTLVMVKQ